MNQRSPVHPQLSKRIILSFTIFVGLLFLPGLSSSANADPASRFSRDETIQVRSPAQENAEEQSTDSTAQEGVYLPLTFMQFYSEPPPPPLGIDTKLYCSTDSYEIPDDSSVGVTSTINIEDPRVILDMDVRLEAEHSWVGDLEFSLTHEESGMTITLIHRPGIPDSDAGCGEANIGAILDDEITGAVENKCSSTSAAISGIYRPDQPLSTFDGEGIAGTWNLRVYDHNTNDTGSLNSWCIAAVIDDVPSPQPPEPPVTDLPKQAQIVGLSGRSQSLPLSCESRSAVDWAGFFGVQLNEIDFHNNLPISDNPDIGFVGNVYGSWGQIPPDPYGVHAEPVAAQLRDHGLSAYARRPLSWDGLRAEIAAGRPVIVWIVGSFNQGQYDYVVNGIPQYYLPQEGHLTVVVPYEHTVIVSGYTEDTVTYLNGGSFYTRTINHFLDSWSVMRNMAITTQP